MTDPDFQALAEFVNGFNPTPAEDEPDDVDDELAQLKLEECP